MVEHGCIQSTIIKCHTLSTLYAVYHHQMVHNERTVYSLSTIIKQYTMSTLYTVYHHQMVHIEHTVYSLSSSNGTHWAHCIQSTIIKQYTMSTLYTVYHDQMAHIEHSCIQSTLPFHFLVSIQNNRLHSNVFKIFLCIWMLCLQVCLCTTGMLDAHGG